jgi:hypothetical protein
VIGFYTLHHKMNINTFTLFQVWKQYLKWMYTTFVYGKVETFSKGDSDGPKVQ